eukprot:38123-Chlamydomonas_euryale.AAC.2
MAARLCCYPRGGGAARGWGWQPVAPCVAVANFARRATRQPAARVLPRRGADIAAGGSGADGGLTIMTCRLALQLGFRVWGVDQAPKLQLATFFLFVRRSLRRAEEAA